MNTAALVIAAGLPMYDSVPAAMFKVGAVSTAQHMISSFEKAGSTAVYLVTDDRTKKLEKQLSSTSALFIRSEGSPLEAAKQAIVSLPKHYERILICCCDRPMLMPRAIKSLLAAKGELAALSHEGKDCGIYLLSMEAAEIFCADTVSESFAEAFYNLGYKMKFLESDEPGLFITPDKAAADESLLELHQNALTRPVLGIEICAEQMIFEPRLVKLLRLINSLRSVRDACEMLGISYSIAWNLLNMAEEQLGYPLIRRNQGGRSGSGSVLTEKGHNLLEAYNGFENELNKKMNSLFDDCFGNII